MSLNFPSAPSLNQTYTAEGRTFVWNGTVWIMQPAALPYATNAEAIAGTRADRLMSPATTRQRTNQIPQGGATHPFGGTPTNMLPSRLRDVNYQNTLGRPMIVCATALSAVTIFAGPSNPAGSVFARNGNVTAGWAAYAMALIPAGWWYRLGINATADFIAWVEYR